MDEEFVDPNDLYENRNEAPNGNLATDSELPQDGLHRTVGYLAAVLGLCVVAYFAFDFNWFAAKTENQIDQAELVPPEKPSSGSGGANRENPSGAEIASNKLKELTGLEIPGAAKFDWAKEEEIAANRSAVENFKSKLEQIANLSNSNSEGLALLRSKTEELRTSQAGAKIASDAKYVAQYIALHEQIAGLEVSIPVAESFSNDMSALLNRVETANDTSYSPQQFVVTRAEEFLKRHTEKAAEIKRFDNALNYLVAETDQLEAGSILETAFQNEMKNSQDNLAESLVRAREEAANKAREQLAQAEKERIQSEADLELAKIQTQTTGNVGAKEVLLSNAARQKLEQEFNADLNDVNVYLLPFISEGRDLRGNAVGKGPVSYSAIKAKGALENTADGLASLSHAAKNGRPLGEFPINIRAFMIMNNSVEGNFYNTAKYRSIEEYLEKAQSLLNKYGPLMVEKGMLAE